MWIKIAEYLRQNGMPEIDVTHFLMLATKVHADVPLNLWSSLMDVGREYLRLWVSGDDYNRIDEANLMKEMCELIDGFGFYTFEDRRPCCDEFYAYYICCRPEQLSIEQIHLLRVEGGY